MIKENNANKLSSSWKTTKHGVAQGSVLGPLLFLIYINDLPASISKIAKSIIFADDTSIVVTNDNKLDFRQNLRRVMIEISNLFQCNRLTLNYGKTHFLQFLTKKQNEMQHQIVTSNSVMTNINCTKFLGLIIDNTLSWKNHITEITPKLNKACYVIRTLTFLKSPELLRMVYFSYFHSIMSYGIIFWGNSHHSVNIFKIQKRIIRIITNSNRYDTCRPLFKQLRILPLPSQYIFSILIFVVTNKKLFQLNSQVHNIHTRYNDNLHLLSTGLTLVQKGVAYSGCKIYNHLPSQIKKNSNNVALYITTLKKFLLQYIFYSVDENYQQNCKDYDYQ